MENYADVLESYVIAEEGILKDIYGSLTGGQKFILGIIATVIAGKIIGAGVKTINTIRTKVYQAADKKKLKEKQVSMGDVAAATASYIEKNLDKATYLGYSENIENYLGDFRKIIQKYTIEANKIIHAMEILIDKPSDVVFDKYASMLETLQKRTKDNIDKLNKTFDFGERKQVSKDEFIKVLKSYNIEITEDSAFIESMGKKVENKYGDAPDYPDDFAESLNSRTCAYFLVDVYFNINGIEISADGFLDDYLWGLDRLQDKNIADQHLYVQF